MTVGPTGTWPWPVVRVVFPDEVPNVCRCSRIVRRTPDGLRLVRVANPDCTSDAVDHLAPT